MAFKNISSDGSTVGGGSQEEAAERYHMTPVFDLDEILRQCEIQNVIPNNNFHVGGGMWVTFCQECGDYALMWGNLYHPREMSDHMFNEHNTTTGPMLPA